MLIVAMRHYHVLIALSHLRQDRAEIIDIPSQAYLSMASKDLLDRVAHNGHHPQLLGNILCQRVTQVEHLVEDIIGSSFGQHWLGNVGRGKTSVKGARPGFVEADPSEVRSSSVIVRGGLCIGGQS